MRRRKRKKLITQKTIEFDNIEKNIMIIDKMLKYHKENIDESSLINISKFILNVSIIYMITFISLALLNLFSVENSFVKLIIFIIATIFITFRIDRIMYKEIKERHKVDVKSYFFPNSDLNKIKVNELKKFLKAYQLYNSKSISFLIDNLDHGTRNKMKIIFPLKNEIITVLISVLVMIISLTFSFSFSLNSDLAISQLGEFFGYFVVYAFLTMILVLLIGNLVYQIFTPTYIRIREVKRLLIQIYLEN